MLPEVSVLKDPPLSSSFSNLHFAAVGLTYHEIRNDHNFCPCCGHRTICMHAHLFCIDYALFLLCEDIIIITWVYFGADLESGIEICNKINPPVLPVGHYVRSWALYLPS